MYAAGLLLTYAVILFAHRGPPSLTDYANWTYQGVLLRDHLLGRPDVAHVLKRYPVPNSAVTVGIGVLALVLPWMIAAKVWLCLQLGVSWVALRHLLRTGGGGAATWVVVPQAVFLNVNLWYGFVNFQLGICWVMLMASLLLRRVRGDGGRGLGDWGAAAGGVLYAHDSVCVLWIAGGVVCVADEAVAGGLAGGAECGGECLVLDRDGICWPGDADGQAGHGGDGAGLLGGILGI